MIVRITGLGQFDLDEDACRRLDQLDEELTAAFESKDDRRFHSALHQTIQFIQQTGSPVPHDQVVPSEVIVPPDDIDLAEAGRFFHDEGFMAPLPA